MKKLLLLGGSQYLLPVIETAHALGLYVITCDYLPDNIAHQHSDEYLNISIIDKDAVLAKAMEKQIDGVMSFACDPGVVTAAYIAEKMGLPFQGSYASTCILQDKGLFRKFLQDNGFNAPHSKRYTDPKAPFDDIDYFTWPVIVKPVDSAGSKGITKAETPQALEAAIQTAVRASIGGAFIVEDFITFQGHHSSADLFTVNGKLKFVTYSDHVFDREADNQYVPTIAIWPSTMPAAHQDYLTHETQRLMDLLHMQNGIYNVESCVGSDGKPYLMEVSPRGGGCKIAEIQQMAMGVNLIENEIRNAVGMPLKDLSHGETDGHWCEMVLHARPGQTGIFKNIRFDPEIEKKYIRLIDVSVKPGDAVKPFTGANTALGNIFLRFDSREELNAVIDRVNEWITIEVE